MADIKTASIFIRCFNLAIIIVNLLDARHKPTRELERARANNILRSLNRIVNPQMGGKNGKKKTT